MGDAGDEFGEGLGAGVDEFFSSEEDDSPEADGGFSGVGEGEGLTESLDFLGNPGKERRLGFGSEAGGLLPGLGLVVSSLSLSSVSESSVSELRGSSGDEGSADGGVERW